ncbi:hypothetical protein ACFSUS_24660 [Spirosoma soli]|uniref:Lipocalin-like domain-containing protein n=1 Tax=Spirosoma soli TaxID=1770529 RepID=A0ABW5MBK7_9BACT
MKKLLIYSLLAAVLFGNSGAGCSSNNADDPQPAKLQSLIGKWQLQRAIFEGVRHDGKIDVRVSEVKKNGGDLQYEFFSDGRLRLTGDPAHGGTRDVRWELSAATVLTSGDIEAGKLKIIGDEERKLAQSLGQSGELTYSIVTTRPLSGSNFSKMSLEIDATKLEADRYKEIVMYYEYHKL